MRLLINEIDHDDNKRDDSARVDIRGITAVRQQKNYHRTCNQIAGQARVDIPTQF